MVKALAVTWSHSAALPHVWRRPTERACETTSDRTTPDQLHVSYIQASRACARRPCNAKGARCTPPFCSRTTKPSCTFLQRSYKRCTVTPMQIGLASIGAHGNMFSDGSHQPCMRKRGPGGGNDMAWCCRASPFAREWRFAIIDYCGAQVLDNTTSHRNIIHGVVVVVVGGGASGCNE